MLLWLTPENMPAASTRRVLLIPDDPQWRAIFRGVLLDLAEPQNWEQYGSVTPAEAAEKWNDVLYQFDQGEVCP